MNPSFSLRPLSIGNVVSAGFRLYRGHLAQYLGIALRATGWAMLPFLGMVPIIGLLVLSFQNDSVNPGFLSVAMLLIIPLVLGWMFCAAKYFTQEAIIARHAYMQLIHQPEDGTTTTKYLRKRLWHFWGAKVIVGLILMGVSFGISMIQQIFLVLPMTLLGTNKSTGVLAALVGLITVAFSLVSWGVQLWFSARFLVVELPIAIEENIGADKSIGRSWNLSKGYGWRILLIILVAGLITLPLYAVGVIPFLVMGVIALARVETLRSEAGVGAAIVSALGLFGFGIVIMMLLNIVVIPFWQTVKAVIYYDLRSRREGLGLELRDQL
jgi:hypothetical protein